MSLLPHSMGQSKLQDQSRRKGVHLFMGGVACVYRDGGNFWWPSLEMIHHKSWFLFSAGLHVLQSSAGHSERILCLVLNSRWMLRVPEGIVVPITFNIFCRASLLKGKFINTFRAFSKQTFATSCYLNFSLLFLPLNVCQLSFIIYLSL